MTSFLKNIFLKWSMIATLGLVAYFLGFSWGVVGLDRQEKLQAQLELQQQKHMQARAPASVTDLESQLRKQGSEEPENFIFLPTSEKPTNLSQLK
jgi:hypothetical protein